MRRHRPFHPPHHPATRPAAQGPGGPVWDAAKLAADFHAAHDKAYGHADAAVPVEFVNLRTEGFGRVPKPPAPAEAAASGAPPKPIARRRIYMDRAHGWLETPVYRRDDLRHGHVIEGPAIAEQRDSTILVLPDQIATVDRGSVIRIRARN